MALYQRLDSNCRLPMYSAMCMCPQRKLPEVGSCYDMPGTVQVAAMAVTIRLVFIHIFLIVFV